MSIQKVINIVVPKGMLGPDELETELDTFVRSIAERVSTNPEEEWAGKYGTDFENDVFMMHRYCWCDQDNCPWCGEAGAPNFLYDLLLKKAHGASLAKSAFGNPHSEGAVRLTKNPTIFSRGSMSEEDWFNRSLVQIYRSGYEM